MSDIEKQPLGISQGYEHVNSGGVIDNYQNKLGAKCCGCCCDMRRATIMLSILFLSLGSINLVVMLGAESVRRATVDEFDDDTFIDIINHSYLQTSIFIGIGVLTNICSIVGALNYNPKLVGINIAWMVIFYVATIVIDIKTINELNDSYNMYLPLPMSAWFLQAILTLFFLYPMASFIREVKTGIMTKESYAIREEYSCCCTTTRAAQQPQRYH